MGCYSVNTSLYPRVEPFRGLMLSRRRARDLGLRSRRIIGPRPFRCSPTAVHADWSLIGPLPGLLSQSNQIQDINYDLLIHFLPDSYLPYTCQQSESTLRKNL